MPILGDGRLSTHADRTSTRHVISRMAHACVREPKGNRCECRGGGGTSAKSSDFYFKLLGEQSSQK